VFPDDTDDLLKPHTLQFNNISVANTFLLVSCSVICTHFSLLYFILPVNY